VPTFRPAAVTNEVSDVQTSLDDLTAKIDAGERLSAQDISTLAASRDIITLGMLATTVRRRLRGSEVTYVRVADLKVSTTAGSTTAGSTTPDSATLDSAAGEVRIFHTPANLDAAIATVERAREIAGDIPLSAFCLFELGKFPEGLSVVLTALHKAGLEAIAQAPIDRLTQPQRSIEALTDAGMRLARLTVNETPERDWAAICGEVAALQTSLGAIRAFAPLARKIDQTQPTTGYEDVKRVAIARVLVDNVDTIQIDWALYGPKLAQVALTFGADDIDSVSADDDTSQGRRRSPVEEIRRSIHAAGFEAVERDGRFARRD
jgi:aminodeoxyfutalosine synthase